MSKKKGNFADQFLDKIIFVLAGLLGLYLIWAFILSNPYEGTPSGQKYSPSEIDQANKRQTGAIVEKLQGPATPKPYETLGKTKQYSQLMQSAIPKMVAGTNWPTMRTIVGENSDPDRIYSIPTRPVLETVELAVIRGAVRMPTEDVTLTTPYNSVACKVADIDFVTVSAHINLQALNSNFQASFNGPRLPPKWKDPTYAEPVFAKIELQRRIQNADGTWGEWGVVPFTKIDPYQKTFIDLPQTTEVMSFGDVDLFKNQFKESAVLRDVLQPAMYQFVNMAAKPQAAQYYNESKKIRDQEEETKAREAREQRTADRERMRNTNRGGGGGLNPGFGGGLGGQPPVPATGAGRPRGNPNPNPNPGAFGTGEPGLGVTRPVKPVRTIADIEADFTASIINDKFKVETSKDVMVWVHDDTALPGKTYQYRIRYGVFNPIAGKDWYDANSKQYKNQVVLWSDFKELPESVTMPPMMHMFPVDVLADNSGAKFEIYKYYTGQWWMEIFEVRTGQIIGKPVTIKEGAAGVVPGLGQGAFGQGALGGEAQQVSSVDYGTGCMLADIVLNQDSKQRVYPQMVYADSSGSMFVLPARKQFWPKEMNQEYNTVKQEFQKTIPTETGGLGGGAGIPGAPGLGGGVQRPLGG